MDHRGNREFWREAFALQGSVTLQVWPLILTFGAVAVIIALLAGLIEKQLNYQIGMAVAPYEIAGAALGLLLVLRTNGGYDRWWEARKLWGGIVNQCRNLAISGLTYGPRNSSWRREFVAWSASFAHVARRSLRSERSLPELTHLIGPEAARAVERAEHMPSYVALRLASLLRSALEGREMSEFGFLQTDRERALLIDHIGACERILKTPLPTAYSIKIRRFLVLFLGTLPFALLHKLETPWLIPLVTMLVAYPLLALDRIGAELQNPFSVERVSHLPLDDISAAIERNLLALLPVEDGAGSAALEPAREAPALAGLPASAGSWREAADPA
jgi:putative membrane protein